MGKQPEMENLISAPLHTTIKSWKQEFCHHILKWFAAIDISSGIQSLLQQLWEQVYGMAWLDVTSVLHRHRSMSNQCKRVLIAYRSNKCRQELVTLWYAFTDLATAAPTTFLIWSWLTCWTASTTQDVQTSFWSVQLNMSRKDFSYLSPGEKSSEGKHAGWHSSSSRQVKH